MYENIFTLSERGVFMNRNDYNNNFYDNGSGYDDFRGVQSGGYSSVKDMSGISMADFSRRVYSWMAAGLSITFILGFVIQNVLLSDPLMLEQFFPVFIFSVILEFIMVIALGFFIYKLPSTVSLILFLVYSVLNGVNIAPALMLADADKAIWAFAATALLFGTFSIYGIVTKRDLTKLRPILLIGLIVLIVFGILGMFFRMGAMDLIISLAGIAIFIGFTAYDTQKIKKGYEYFSSDEEMLKRASINIALQLYLDFINLFLYILRLFSRNSR